MSLRLVIVVLLALVTLAVLALQEDPHPASEHRPPRTVPGGDLVAHVNQRVRSAGAAHDDPRGYLPAVLDALEIPVASQLLVFAKTSRQHAMIGASTPRAIYFNDRAAVGFVPGADELEIALFDGPGARFLTLAQTPGTGPPELSMGTRCFECHTLPESGGLQGLLLRSVDGVAASGSRTSPAPVATGSQVLSAHDVDDRTPYPLRWNGWYVSGARVPPGHLGRPPSVDPHVYPAATSDVVALLVLGHEVEMTNRVLRLADTWRERGRQGSAGEPARVAQAVDDVVRHMVFADETPLPAPAQGDPAFAEAFAAAGRRDAQGRSLRDLDLERRLFRYPCSFMIHAPVFERLPVDAKQAVYARLSTVLRSEGPAAASAADRRAAAEILRATVRDLPADF